MSGLAFSRAQLSLAPRRAGADHAAALARHQHRQRRSADPVVSLRRAVPRGAVGCHRLPARRDDARRRGRSLRRPLRPAAPAARRHRRVRAGLRRLRPCPEPRAADRGARGAGAWRGATHGAERGRDRRRRAGGADRPGHGPARHRLGGGHGARPVARRDPVVPCRLAVALFRHGRTGHRRAAVRRAAPAGRCRIRRATLRASIRRACWY